MYSYVSRLMTLYVLFVWTANTNAAPTGPMADYFLNCDWGLTYSEAACTTLMHNLEGVEHKTPAEKLILLKSREAVAEIRGDVYPMREFCGALRSIVEEHPRYAEALYSLSHCVNSREESVVLLQRALDIEPDNFNALSFFVRLVQNDDGSNGLPWLIDSQTFLEYLEAFYDVAKVRAEWEFSNAPSDSGSSRSIWQGLFVAARYIYLANVLANDQNALKNLQLRVRHDAGLDDLDYKLDGSCRDEWKDCRRGSGEDNLRLICDPILREIGLGDYCLSAVEKLVGDLAVGGNAIPEIILNEVEFAIHQLRHRACGKTVLVGDECRGWEATETVAIARLRTILKNYGGEWSSEHHRIYAQGFLGDNERLDGLRESLRVNPQNTRARCELARALEARAESVEARTVLGDGDPECLKYLGNGFTLLDREDVLAWQQGKYELRRQEARLPSSDR